jgi:rRNA maturation protein Nop10
MDSVRQGLRSDDIEKDTYERLSCGVCGERLKSKNDPEEVYTVRFCPECGSEWKQL